MTYCPFCSSLHFIKHGALRSGAQRFLCKICKKSFSCGGKRATYNEEFKHHVIENYCHQKEKAITVSKNYNISTATLIKWSKNHKKDCSICEL